MRNKAKLVIIRDIVRRTRVRDAKMGDLITGMNQLRKYVEDMAIYQYDVEVINLLFEIIDEVCTRGDEYMLVKLATQTGERNGKI